VSDQDAAPRALPQSVLRSATDKTLLDEIVNRGQTTRAELATATGISKPTVSESVRRLVEGGLLAATGPRETGRRGRIATFYELAETAGWVLAIMLDQSGVHAWSSNLAGRPLHQHDQPPAGDTSALVGALRAVTTAATEKAGTAHGPLRAIAVSVANPVDPTTHEVTALRDSPFPAGLMSPADALTGTVRAPVLVDNDVNLAALAEHRAGAAAGAASFAYVYVGAGLGLGLYIGDQLIRGAHGLAGEIGYLPGARSGTLAAELAASGFGRPDAPATDVNAVIRLLDKGSVRAARVISAAIARAVTSVNAVVDPELILLGGPLGTHPALLEPVREAVAAISPGPTRLAPGTLGVRAPLHGATHLAVEHARATALAT